MKNLNLILAALVFSAFCVRADAQQAAVVLELRGAHMVIAGTAVRIDDVALVSVVVPEGRDPRVVQYRVGSAEILSFKNGAMTGEISHVDLKLALKRLGYTDVSISGPERIQISRKSKELDNRRVLDLARSHVKNALAGIDEEATVTFVRRLDPVRIPAGRYSMDVRFEGDPANPEYIGDTDLRLVAEIDGVVEELARVPVRVQRRLSVIRLARNVRRGDVVTNDDIVSEEREVAQLANKLFFRIEDVVGQLAVRDLKSGAELMKADLKARPIVRKDDFVSVRVRKGQIQVETLCQAMQDGAPGDRILFKNIASERTVEAVIVDRQNAEIVLGK